MSEIHELLVSVRPEGADETQEQVDEVGESFQETADDVGEAGDLLDGFADQFERAGLVAVAAMGTVAAGLLAQIPVLREAATGLSEIVRSIFFRIDQQLRPAVSGLTEDFFAFSEAIRTADGPMGDLVDVFALATGIFLGALVVLGGIAAVLLGVAAAAGITVGAVLGIVAIIGVMALALATLIKAWQKGWIDISTITNIASTNIIDIVKGAVSMLQTLFQLFKLAGTTAFELFKQLVLNKLKSWANTAVQIVEDAVNTIIRNFNRVASQLPGLEQLGQVDFGTPFEVRSRSEIMRTTMQDFEQQARGILGIRQQRGRVPPGEAGIPGAPRGDDGGGRLDELIQALQTGTMETQINLDGRELGSDLQQFIGEGTAAQGRTKRTR